GPGTPTPTATPNGTPTPAPTATSIPCNPGLSAEAESGVLHGAFITVADSLAANGQSVLTLNGSGSLEAPDAAHRVDICVTVATAGQYRIVAWALGPDADSDSFFLQVDGQPTTAERWTIAQGDIYAPNAAPLRPSLAAGEHIVSFLLREDGARLDRIELQYVGPPVSPTPTSTPLATSTATPTLAVPTPTLTPTLAPTLTPTASGNPGTCNAGNKCNFIYLPNIKRP
ncbi:MAG: hypothetical protein KDE54_38865, partial [Caldilineaceae bacterium]|nr:hypothetical protein [Caldilineaceae bacterium]